jgi:hypothetical protein
MEAETDNCNNPISPITDEWFDYDEDGRILDIWELTPNSGQYYHSVATYYADGTLNTVQLASPSLYTMTYQLDPEGRPNGLVGPSSKTLVSQANTSFYPSGAPNEISIGTGSDQDDYLFDQYTGLMTSFEFKVGSNNLTGQVNWNTNDSLGNLAITDGFNSGGTQTCYATPSSGSTAGYDDLGRLLNF